VRAERIETGLAAAAGGEPLLVRDLRNRFVTWLSVCGSLFVIDVATGNHTPSWSLVVAGIWAATKLVPRYVRLWNAGYSWRDVLARPPAPDAMERRAAAGSGRPAELPPATSGEFGRHAAAIQQARNDRKAILRVLERLPKSERRLLPDVVATVDGLLHRAEELARALQALGAAVDEAALGRLQEKIEATKRQDESPERARQLDLLERQRQALADLLTRRQLIEDQLESCVLAMQNVRFDLLRLRSAGVAAVLDDLTHATQQARALSRDVDHAIGAAAEIRDALGGAAARTP
jgi:serine/threonine-protein kinase